MKKFKYLIIIWVSLFNLAGCGNKEQAFSTEKIKLESILPFSDIRPGMNLDEIKSLEIVTYLYDDTMPVIQKEYLGMEFMAVGFEIDSLNY